MMRQKEKNEMKALNDAKMAEMDLIRERTDKVIAEKRAKTNADIKIIKAKGDAKLAKLKATAKA